MTHPPTEPLRKSLYAVFSASERERRLSTKPRPSNGREFVQEHESGASSLSRPIPNRPCKEIRAREARAEREAKTVLEIIRRYTCPWIC